MADFAKCPGRTLATRVRLANDSLAEYCGCMPVSERSHKRSRDVTLCLPECYVNYPWGGHGLVWVSSRHYRFAYLYRDHSDNFDLQYLDRG